MLDSFEKILDTFSMMDSWEDKYGYLIDLGREIPPLEESKRQDMYKVDGCVSNVWFVPRIEKKHGESFLFFEADSDAHIVKGIIAVLMSLLNGKSLNLIDKADILELLGPLELKQHLTFQRSNGLSSMIKKIKDIASSYNSEVA